MLQGTDSLVFTDHVTADGKSRMNSEVCGALLSDQIQSNAAELIGLRLHQSTQLSPSVKLTKDKTKGAETHKPAAPKAGCSKGYTVTS